MVAGADVVVSPPFDVRDAVRGFTLEIVDSAGAPVEFATADLIDADGTVGGYSWSADDEPFIRITTAADALDVSIEAVGFRPERVHVTGSARVVLESADSE